jgi:phosphoribosylformylglycinamidine cyclo-ligase
MKPVLALRDAGLAKSAAHITGGGLQENVPRALPAGLGAEILPSWEPQPIFDLVASGAGLDRDALFGVLNMGVGMVVVVPAADASGAVELANHNGVSALLIGSVTAEPGLHVTQRSARPEPT